MLTPVLVYVFYDGLYRTPRARLRGAAARAVAPVRGEFCSASNRSVALLAWKLQRPLPVADWISKLTWLWVFVFFYG